MDSGVAGEVLGVKFLIVSNSVLALICIGLVAWIFFNSSKKAYNERLLKKSNANLLNDVFNVEQLNRMETILSEFNSKLSGNEVDWKRDESHSQLIGGLFKMLNGVLSHFHEISHGKSANSSSVKEENLLVSKGLSQILQMIESLRVLIENSINKSQEYKIAYEHELALLKATEVQLKKALAEEKANGLLLKSQIELLESNSLLMPDTQASVVNYQVVKEQLEADIGLIRQQLESEKKLFSEYRVDAEKIQTDLNCELTEVRNKYEEIQQIYIRTIAEKEFIENAYVKDT